MRVLLSKSLVLSLLLLFSVFLQDSKSGGVKKLEVGFDRDGRFLPYEVKPVTYVNGFGLSKTITHPVHVLSVGSPGGADAKYVRAYNPSALTDDPAIFSFVNFSEGYLEDDDPVKGRLSDVTVYTNSTTGKLEVIGTLCRNDSVFVVKNLPDSEVIEQLYITSGTDHTGDRVWEATVPIVLAEDYDFDGVTEIILQTQPGRDMYPRELFCVDPERLVVEWSLPLAGTVDRRKVLSVRDSAHPAIVFVSGNPAHGARDDNFEDYYSYLVKVDHNGNVVYKSIISTEFKPIGIVRGPADTSYYVIHSQPFLAKPEDAVSEPSSLSISRIDRDCAVLGTVSNIGEVKRIWVSDLEDDGEVEILTSNSRGVIRVFSESLTCLSQSDTTSAGDYVATFSIPGMGDELFLFAAPGGVKELYNKRFEKLFSTDLALTYIEPLELDERGEVVSAVIGGGNVYGIVTFNRRGAVDYARALFWDFQPYMLLLMTVLVVALIVANHYRRKKDRVIDEFENRFHALTEASPIGICVYQKGRVVYANPRLVELGGYSSGELIDMEDPLLVFHPDDRQVVKERIERLLASDVDMVESLTRVTTKDGAIKYIESQGSRMMYGGKLAVVATFVDVTSRVEIEGALEEERATLNSIIDYNPYSIAIFDSEGRYLRGNRAFVEMFRVEPYPDYSLFTDPIFSREDFFEDAVAAVRRGEPFVAPETWYNLRDIHPELPDTPMCLRVTVFPVADREDHQKLFVVMHHNITAQKEAEAGKRESGRRFRTLAEESPIGIGIIQAGEWRFVNEVYACIHGYDRDAFMALGPLGRVHPEDQRTVEARIAECVGDHSKRESLNARVIHADGENRVLEYRVLPLVYEGTPATVVMVVDVTDAIRARDALAESEQRYRTLQENVPIAMFRARPSGRAISVNPAMVELYGFDSAEELLEREPVLQYINPDERDEYIRQIRDNGYVRDFETKIRTRDGRIKWVSSSARAVYDADGRLAFFDGIDIDITERKQAEDALSESEEKYRSVLEQSSDAIFLLDVESLRIIESNAAVERLLGYSSDEMRSLRIYDFVRQPRTVIEQQIDTTLNTGSLYLTGRVYVRKDGGTRHVDISINRITYRGKRVLCVVARDISETKKMLETLGQSEERLRAQYRSIPVPTYTWKMSGNTFVLDEYNDMALEITDGKIAQLKGRTYEEIYPEWSEAKVDMQTCISTGRIIKREMEYHFKTTGRRRTLWVSYAFVPPDCVLVHTEDITEWKSAEEALRESETKFKALTEETIVGTYIYQDGKFQYINPRLAEMFGYAIEDLLAHPDPITLVHPDDQATVRKNIMMRLRREVDYVRYTFRFVPPNGKMRHIEVFGSQMEYRGKPAVIGTMLDVTESRAAGEALRESEEKLRSLFENAPAVILVISLDGTIQYVNRVLPGFTREDVVGTSCYNYIDERDLERYREAAQQVITSGETREIEMRAISRPGSRIWYKSIISALKSETRVTALTVIAVDVTEQRIAEEALRQSEHRYALATAATRSGIWDWDLAGGEFYLDKSIKGILGYSDSEVPNDLNAWLDHIHPDDRDRVLSAAQAHIDGETEEYVVEHRMRHRDGSYRWILARGKVVRDSTGRATRMIGSNADVTDRKEAELAREESEQIFRTLAESTSAAILIFQGDRMVYTNPMASAITGFTQEELLTFNFWDIIHPEARGMVKQRGLARQRGEAVPISYEVPLLTKSGGKRWMLFTGDLIEYNGKAAVLGTAFDISDRKRAEAELALANQERYSQVKEVAGGIAHEIYNSLFPATSTLFKLKERVSEAAGVSKERERDLDLIELAETAVSRAIGMTELVTRFSHLESEKNLQPNRVLPIVESIIRENEEVQQLGIEVTVDIPSDLELCANRFHLYSLFSNLISNAVDALHQRSVRRIDISARRQDGRVVLEVKDTGGGIPEGIREKVFSAFYSTKPQSGTGLGLAICRKIVDIYGGKIVMDSEVDKGTKFTILMMLPEDNQ